ncbi:AT rich interactive domain 1A (SWI-like) [Caenorhabditis elegans]|uniref:AT rich interactive domain 1A (SWI-like) n=1 Tax=Caenorhabditis elegans TaxID=6239 RepID=Q5WRN0_CAEEL|nr:AT rich interactive domain 1A (SWI-like) [Caenorhabditis elegans]CAH60759.2 AT rich interactive domain 1A (SWI-like) [Caenorhabditis elegans]
MSTSFPNSNGNVPPYNQPTNGSFNQFGQGGYPGIDQFQHPNMYAPPANGYGGMPPGPPNIGGPQPPGGSQQKGQQQQFPGSGANMKLPGYDGNSMQNAYMPYPPQNQRSGGQAPQNGPPPNYNSHQQMPPNNQYGGVPDPYRMYPGMQGPPGQVPNSQNSSSQQRPPSQNANQQRPASQAGQQYPTQQALPAHLHGTPTYPGMPPQNAPLQHYQPPQYANGTPPVRGAGSSAFPPLQPSKQSKPDEHRPNNLSNSQYPGNFGAPGSSSGFDSFSNGSSGYQGYGLPGSGTPGSQGNTNNLGMNGATPGSYGFKSGPFGGPNQNLPGQSTSGHNTPGHSTSGQNTSAQNATSGLTGPTGNPFGSMNGQGGNHGQFGGNDLSGVPGPSGGYGQMNSSNTPNQSERSTPGQPSTPGTPGSHGTVGSNAPLSHQKPSQQQQSMHNHLPHHQYNQNNLLSPNHGASSLGSQKQHGSSPMGSSLMPLNGQYPSMTQNMQSPASTSMEPTFKEPAVPIRHSPSQMPTHLQSPVHPSPNGAPPAYNAPSSSKTPDPTQQQRPHSPTFAVPTLPAAATLAQAFSANQISTKPKTSPQKKKHEDGVPEPPTADTPFTTVTHYELPAAMTFLRDTLHVGPNDKVHPQVEKHYFSRKRQQLRVPYPEGINSHTTPPTEPNTFGFMQGNPYFDPKYNRMVPSQTSHGPPLLSRSQSMHTPMISPNFNASQPSTSGRQPAKKARSASDASEPPFNVPHPPSSRGSMDQRQLQQQQIQMQQYHQHMQMQKMQQQQMAAQQQMSRMGGSGPSSAGPGGSQLPSLSAPSLQRADSMPQLPSQQQPPMGGPMANHMGGMQPMNGTPTEGYYRPDGQQYWPQQQQRSWPPASEFEKPGPGWEPK